MHNRKRVLLVILVVLLSAAAFIGARFLYTRSEAIGMGTVSSENAKRQTGPRIEVFVSGKTAIYRETTSPSKPLSAENQWVVQTVAPATLDDLDSRSMIMVWGAGVGIESLQTYCCIVIW